MHLDSGGSARVRATDARDWGRPGVEEQADLAPPGGVADRRSAVSTKDFRVTGGRGQRARRTCCPPIVCLRERRCSGTRVGAAVVSVSS